MARMAEGFPDLDKYLEGRGRKFVTYSEGADIYDIPYYSFVRLAKVALTLGAILLRCASRVTRRYTQREEISGGDGADRAYPRGSRNLYR